MTVEDLLEESTKGGPGLDGYAYNADVYCESCAEDLMRELAPKVAPTLDSTDDPEFRDSETWPQPIFFGEADTKQHCGDCGEYLYGEDESVTDEERSYGPNSAEAKAARLVDEDVDRTPDSDPEDVERPEV